MANYQDIAIALAGVCQTANLVQQFAHKGTAERDVFKCSLESLLITQPDSTLDVFGELNRLAVGLETTLAQFGGKQGKLDTEIGRYWIGILALSQKLENNPQAKSALAQRLQQLQRQLALYENNILHEQMIANIANIYSDIISPLGSKIHVVGMQDHLSRVEVQHRVRASLLAGIRAGILWQQVGGSRWQFLFSRRKLLANVKALHSRI